MRLKHTIIALLLATVAVFPVQADSLDGYPLLRESYDPGLQKRLEASLRSLRLARAVADRRLSVALVDITDVREPRVASVNGDEMIYAASLPKIAILLGAFVEIERGNMQLDEPTRHSLTQMIRVSSNVEATRMLNRVGKRNLLKILRSDRYRLYDPVVNGGLWVGKEYGKAGAYQRDPLHNLSHGATALQVARFYYLLETDQLVSPALSREMKRILSRPAINHKFVKGLAGVSGLRMYRKSGTWRHWHADSALVKSGGRKYIVVALAQDSRGGTWLTRLIRPLHEIIMLPAIALAGKGP